jgi:hypothetical protein
MPHFWSTFLPFFASKPKGYPYFCLSFFRTCIISESPITLAMSFERISVGSVKPPTPPEQTTGVPDCTQASIIEALSETPSAASTM